jgi:hypothetical protein
MPMGYLTHYKVFRWKAVTLRFDTLGQRQTDINSARAFFNCMSLIHLSKDSVTMICEFEYLLYSYLIQNRKNLFKQIAIIIEKLVKYKNKHTLSICFQLSFTKFVKEKIMLSNSTKIKQLSRILRRNIGKFFAE